VTDALQRILDYHEATKHRLRRFARGPGRLDWAAQPDPFRRYHGTTLIPLPLAAGPEPPRCDASLRLEPVPPSPLAAESLGRLFYHSLAISAWKEYGGERWALRCNPSSGNLHPTEGHLVCGPVEGLWERPCVTHYAPREHGLELRAELPAELWGALAAGWPAGTCFLGLGSIPWRESWKYGERAFRYCQLDVGHAVAAVSLAAAGLGWRARVLDGWGRDELSALLGLTAVPGAAATQAELEEPEVLLAVGPAPLPGEPPPPPRAALSALERIEWRGEPSCLGPRHRGWPRVVEAILDARKPPTANRRPPDLPALEPAAPAGPRRSLQALIRQRRSAVSMDRRTALDREDFWRLLDAVRPRAGSPFWESLAWPPQANLLIFVHRVEGVEPGLYLFLRDPSQESLLREFLRPVFRWEHPAECPESLALFLLTAGDQRDTAQEIAGDGCFSLGMLSRFRPVLADRGPWFYTRLFWECGAVGQALYLAAEAAGMSGTGLGCYFDDEVHELLGLTDDRIQSLYHFTVGRARRDRRLITLPAYPAPETSPEA
jgi:SagB-type dehydrogenase family enzyme